MSPRTSKPSARLLAGVAAVIAALALAGCGSGKPSVSSSNAPPSSQSTPSVVATPPSVSAGPSGGGAGAQAEIAHAWETFFDGSTSADQKVGLLQNGQQFQQAIQAQANSPLAKSAAAKVSDVTVNGSQATVTYTITLGGQPALGDQHGQAILAAGTWKVSDASFCALLALENGGAASGLPPACGAGASGSPAA